MFDIGIGEIVVIAVIGLLVFGPDRLPRAAADAAKWLKQIRGMASGARQELADSAGLDLSDTVKELRNRNAPNLAEAMKATNAKKKLAKTSPSASMVIKWVAQAKTLTPAIRY